MAEARVACKALNRMTALGMPKSKKVHERGRLAEIRQKSDLCTKVACPIFHRTHTIRLPTIEATGAML